jgi:hypothetical protein
LHQSTFRSSIFVFIIDLATILSDAIHHKSRGNCTKSLNEKDNNITPHENHEELMIVPLQQLIKTKDNVNAIAKRTKTEPKKVTNSSGVQVQTFRNYKIHTVTTKLYPSTYQKNS